MLRLFVGLLLLANLAFFAWSQGWLDEVVGARARGDREPERLAQQVRPESVRVLPPASSAVAVASPVCLEAGPFAPADLPAAQAALQSMAPGLVGTELRIERPGRWLVYMGPYADRDTLQRKVEEIRRTRSEPQEVSVPAEGPFGLALGEHVDRASAERALQQAQQRGIRTARVVQAEPGSVSHMLRVERADATLASALTATRLPGIGAAFAPCAPASTPR